MQMAVDRGKLGSNPCAGVKLIPVDNEEMQFLLPAQIALLAESIDKRYRAYVLVQAYGGLRSGEMAALRPNHVDLAEGRIDVRENVSEVGGQLVWGPPKTRRGLRSVILPEEVMVELAQHMGTSPGNKTVFAAPNGGVLRATSWRRRYWREGGTDTVAAL